MIDLLKKKNRKYPNFIKNDFTEFLSSMSLTMITYYTLSILIH
jgi:hypothetical protein